MSGSLKRPEPTLGLSNGRQRRYLNSRRSSDQALTEVRLKIRLYAAFFGFVSQPQPRGAFTPSLCLTARFHDVRAAMLFLMLGLRIPNFMASCEARLL